MTEGRASGTVVVTGGNAGLGLETVRAIAASGNVSDLVVACRDVARGRVAIDTIPAGATRLHLAELDLASLESVRAFPTALDALGLPPIVALVCNAGVQIIDGTRWSKDGIEETFAVNVLGHFALVKLLLDRVSAQARVIFISSGTHDPSLKTGMPNPSYTCAADLAAGKGPPDMRGGALGRFRYTTSKLCDVYLAYELAKRFPMFGDSGPTLVVSAMDPGLMAGSGLARDYGALSRFIWRHALPRLSRFIKGASSTKVSGADVARLATDPAFARESGVYYIGTTPSSSSALSYDQFNAVDLWNTCATLAGLDP